MHANHLLLEEPIRMASILEPSKAVSPTLHTDCSFLSLNQLFYVDLLFSRVVDLINLSPCRVTSLRWRRSLGLSARNPVRSTSSPVVSRLECLVIWFFLAVSVFSILCWLLFTRKITHSSIICSWFHIVDSIVSWLGENEHNLAKYTGGGCNLVELLGNWAVARFDFTWGDAAYHQETLENLKAAIKSTKKLCAVRETCFNIGLAKIIFFARPRHFACIIFHLREIFSVFFRRRHYCLLLFSTRSVAYQYDKLILDDL